jgi:hypothetical protein
MHRIFEIIYGGRLIICSITEFDAPENFSLNGFRVNKKYAGYTSFRGFPGTDFLS